MLWISAAEQSLWMNGVRELMNAEFLQMQPKSVSWQPVEPMLDSAGACCKFTLALIEALLLEVEREPYST